MTADFGVLDQHVSPTITSSSDDIDASALRVHCSCGEQLLPGHTYEATFAEVQQLYVAHLRAVLHDS